MLKKVKVILILSLILNVIFAVIGLNYLRKNGGIDLIKVKIDNKFAKKNVVSNPVYTIETSQYKDLANPNIVFLGDSLTHYGNWSELLDKNIANRGIVGDDTTQVLSRVNSIFTIKPKKIFIMLGTNDLDGKKPIDIIVNNYTNLINKIKNKAPNSNLYIESVLPVDANLCLKTYGIPYYTKNNEIVNLNSKLKTLASKEKINYIDVYSAFAKNGEINDKYTVDGVHLNGQGYKIWAQAIEKYVNQ